MWKVTLKAIRADTGTGSKSVSYLYDPPHGNASNVKGTKQFTLLALLD